MVMLSPNSNRTVPTNSTEELVGVELVGSTDGVVGAEVVVGARDVVSSSEMQKSAEGRARQINACVAKLGPNWLIKSKSLDRLYTSKTEYYFKKLELDGLR